MASGEAARTTRGPAHRRRRGGIQPTPVSAPQIGPSDALAGISARVAVFTLAELAWFIVRSNAGLSDTPYAGTAYTNETQRREVDTALNLIELTAGGAHGDVDQTIHRQLTEANTYAKALLIERLMERAPLVNQHPHMVKAIVDSRSATTSLVDLLDIIEPPYVPDTRSLTLQHTRMLAVAAMPPGLERDARRRRIHATQRADVVESLRAMGFVSGDHDDSVSLTLDGRRALDHLVDVCERMWQTVEQWQLVGLAPTGKQAHAVMTAPLEQLAAFQRQFAKTHAGTGEPSTAGDTPARSPDWDDFVVVMNVLMDVSCPQRPESVGPAVLAAGAADYHMAFGRHLA